jgi:DNA ligase (NAD+)
MSRYYHHRHFTHFTFFILIMLTRRYAAAWIIRSSPCRLLTTPSPSVGRLFSSTSSSSNSGLLSTSPHDELQSLVQQIQYHDELYYIHSNPVLSDDEFDALVQREQELSQQYPHLQLSTRSKRVGAMPTTGLKRHHTTPMLSLDNGFTQDDLQAWLDKLHNSLGPELAILSEPKLDGLSLSLRYVRNGTNHDDYALAWASTRGDGHQGSDVTAAVLEMGLPTTLSLPAAPTASDSFEVRGEVVLPTKVFETSLKATFRNARNAASGILLRKETNMALRKELRFYAYDLVGVETITTGQAMRDLLQTFGFQVPTPVATTTVVQQANGTNHLMAFHSTLLEQRHLLDHDMDGAVHKLSSLPARQTLGATHRAPRWALAHKFPSMTVMTRLLGIEIQVGRTGALTPVAHLEPVDIHGALVQRATLHNFDHVQSLTGRTTLPYGTYVMVRRAGDVIPQVVSMVLDCMETSTDDDANNTTTISLAAPTECPACHSPVVEDVSNDTAKVLRCGGPPLLCPPRAVAALAHAMSRDALDIKGLSERKIEQLWNASVLKRPSDLFLLEDMDLIANLTGWGPKSATALHETAQKVATNGVTLSRFIYSLGIRFAGQRSSELVAEQYGTVEAFLDEVNQAAKPDSGFARLRTVKGIGPALLSSMLAFANDIDSVQAARDLASVIRVIPVKVALPAESSVIVDETKPWNGWAVVFTGALPDMSRSDAKALAKDLLGAKSTPATVSKSTNLVVAGDKGGKKLSQAISFGVDVMDAAEFIKLVDAHKK